MTRWPQHPPKTYSLQKTGSSLRSQTLCADTAQSNEIWLLTFCDLLMLLMIFFVFLLAVPMVQTAKNAKAASEKTAKTLEATSPQQRIVPSSAFLKTQAAEITAVSDRTGQEPNRGDAALLEDDLRKFLDSRDNGQGVTVEQRAQSVVITFPERILFDSGQARMKPAVGQTLAKLSAFIAGHPNVSVEIQGHTDDLPIRSARYPSNWELSADRATQVARALLEQGARPEQIATKGFGEYHPLVPNNSHENRLKNRRVEIQFSLSPA